LQKAKDETAYTRRAKVASPSIDKMRFVDNKPSKLMSPMKVFQNGLHGVVAIQFLRGHVGQAWLFRSRPKYVHIVPVLRILGSKHHHINVEVAESIDLVRHESTERGDDNSYSARFSTLANGRQLKAQALTATSWHQHDSIATIEGRYDSCKLVFPKCF
jgi:hypothetical protein